MSLGSPQRGLSGMTPPVPDPLAEPIFIVLPTKGVIEPIAGEVTLERYQAVRDARGRIVAYDAWITR